jgi:hypothetical protein
LPKKGTLALVKKFQDGISILDNPEDADGRRRIRKEKFLEVLSYDLDGTGKDEGYTKEEIDYIQKYISQASIGSGSLMALVCKGKEECPYAQKCPLAQIDKAPSGKPCPVENILFREFLVRYMEDLQVDPSNMGELAYCRELSETEILLMRVNKQLGKSENSDMTSIQQSITKGGDVIENQIVSPLLDVRERLVKRRERILKLMVGDRQEKYKEAAARKVKDGGDITVLQSKKRALILDMQMKRELAKPDTEDKPLTPDDLLRDDEDGT